MKGFFHPFIYLIISWNYICGQNTNQTSEEYEYIEGNENPVYFKPVINVNVEMPTSAPNDYEYEEEYYDIYKTESPTTTVTTNILSYCGRICESTEFDSITSLTFKPNSTEEMVILFRDKCFWIIDIKNNLTHSQYGTEHHFLFDKIEASFATPVSDNQINLTAIFTSGLSSQSFLFNGSKYTELVKTIQPFTGLSVDTKTAIDDTFIWVETKTLYFIQNRKYFAFDLINRRQFSGYPRNLTDFGLNLNQSISSVTVIQKQIYFFNETDFAVFSVKNRDNESAVFSGQLTSFNPIDKLFLKCPKISISLRNLDLNSTSNTTSFPTDDDDGDDESKKEFPSYLILTLTLVFIFLIIASIILVFVLIRNNSIKRKLNETQQPINPQLQQPQQVEQVKEQTADNHKIEEKPKEFEELVNKISIYSSGKSVSTNAVINVKI